MPLINELQKIGLSDKESKVYLATLELGQSSVQSISKKAGVNRTTTYVILDSLIKKGLCSTYQQDKKIYYMAESPEILSGLFSIQQKELEEKKKFIERLMPQLRAIYNRQEDKPIVRFFEGKEGLRSMSNELLSSREKFVRMMYSADNVEKVFSAEERKYMVEGRSKKNISGKVLYTYTKGQLPPSKIKGNVRIRISEKDFPITADVALFDGKVRIASMGKKLSGVIIQDQEIYKTLVSLFELAWEAAKAKEGKSNQ